MWGDGIFPLLIDSVGLPILASVNTQPTKTWTIKSCQDHIVRRVMVRFNGARPTAFNTQVPNSSGTSY